MKRFASHTNEEIEDKRKKLHSNSTLKANEGSARILRDYLGEKGENIYFENFDTAKLNNVLSAFYFDVRKHDGEEYTVNSLEGLRHGLNRYLKCPPRNKTFDIIKDAEFLRANDSFRSAMAELKRLGKGLTKHHPVINEVDLNTLFSSTYMNSSTPVGLQNKVQFDIRLYFFRRGAENMHTMTKETFIISTDNNGRRCVRKNVDELTKNHRENDKEIVSAIMPENPNESSCPVSTFEKYLEKLHPSCNRLWQKPRDCFRDDDPNWYCNVPVGVNTLQKFMPNLSKCCKLSLDYKNHSIRATGATMLSRCQFGAAQIMSVTGHKSVSSLSVYQRVGDEEKVRMGQAIQSVLKTSSPALPSSSTNALRQLPSIQSAVSTASSSAIQTSSNQLGTVLGGVNIADLFCDFADLPTNNRQLMPILYQCKIENLHIHHH